MTENDITLIRESFAHLHRRKTQTAQIFYDRLFEIAPEVRPLFKGDIKAQGNKLMETLLVAITRLNDRDGLTILLEKLGRSHRSYHVEPRHYDHVGAALIWTLRTSLEDGFTPAHERAWTSLYGDIAATMIGAAKTA